jgi:DNA-directed RNA polymerase
MMIHDSFATSGDVWDLYHSVRHTFVEMYDDHCVFKAFQDDIRRDLEHPSDLEKPKNKVPPIPAKGTLDLQGIKDSEFCFS